MTVILEIVLPVFGIVMLGFGANKFGWFSEQAERGEQTPPKTNPEKNARRLISRFFQASGKVLITMD